MMEPDLALRELVAAIVAGDAANVSRLLGASPALASACCQSGTTRQTAKTYYLDPSRTTRHCTSPRTKKTHNCGSRCPRKESLRRRGTACRRCWPSGFAHVEPTRASGHYHLPDRSGGRTKCYR